MYNLETERLHKFYARYEYNFSRPAASKVQAWPRALGFVSDAIVYVSWKAVEVMKL